MATSDEDLKKLQNENAERILRQINENERKVGLEEMGVHEVGMKYPSSHGVDLGVDGFTTVNSVIRGETFFAATVRKMPYSPSEFNKYLITLVMTHKSKDRFGFDVNKLNYNGMSNCKVVIKHYNEAVSKSYIGEIENHLANLLQKLIDTGASLTSDEHQSETTLAFMKQYYKPQELNKNLSQTPLDYAFEVCSKSLTNLNNLDCPWKGFPDTPPDVSAPVKILLKAIYKKVVNDTLQAKETRSTAMNESFKEINDFPPSLIRIIEEYSMEPALFKFTYRQSSVNQLLLLGKLFCEYDDAMERKQKGEKEVAGLRDRNALGFDATAERKQNAENANAGTNTQDINAILFAGTVLENDGAKNQGQSLQSFQAQTAMQFKNFADQLAALRSDQDKMKKEFTEQIAQQRVLFTDAFKQVTESLKKLNASRSKDSGSRRYTQRSK